NNAQSLRLEFAEHGEETLDLVRVETRRRLVEHQRFRPDIERAGDRHQLLDRQGMTVERLRDLDFHIDASERRGGANVDLLPVNATEFHRLAAAINDLRHGKNNDKVD